MIVSRNYDAFGSTFFVSAWCVIVWICFKRLDKRRHCSTIIKEGAENWVVVHTMSFAFENEHWEIFHAEKSFIVR